MAASETYQIPATCKKTIDVLHVISLDCAELHCASEEVRGRPGEPIARLRHSGGPVLETQANIVEKRILEVYPGQDGRIRVAKTQVERGTLVRPVTKLCPLEYRL